MADKAAKTPGESNKEKGKKGREKEVSSAPAIEWDSNRSSSHCILCKVQWGTFRNRRHHCRHCGRLVCEACSPNRFVLTTPNAAGVISNEPQRVCLTCYEALRQKKEKKIQVVQNKDKNLELMLSTSLISDSLISLFYLDGSTKTIGIDESTTVKDLAALACPSIPIALFEVVQNVQDAGQYKLLLPTLHVVDIINKWQQTGQPYIKVVIPLSSAACDLPVFGAGRGGGGGGEGGTESVSGTATQEGGLRSYSQDSTYTSTMRSTIGGGGGGGGMDTDGFSSSSSSQAFTPTHASNRSIYKAKPHVGVSSPIFLATTSDVHSASASDNGDTTSNNNNTNNNSGSGPISATGSVQQAATAQGGLATNSGSYNGGGAGGGGGGGGGGSYLGSASTSRKDHRTPPSSPSRRNPGGVAASANNSPVPGMLQLESTSRNSSFTEQDLVGSGGGGGNKSASAMAAELVSNQVKIHALKVRCRSTQCIPCDTIVLLPSFCCCFILLYVCGFLLLFFLYRQK
jgi:hypothetical protein